MKLKRLTKLLAVVFILSIFLCSCTKSYVDNINNNNATSTVTDTNNNNSENKSIQKLTPDEAVNLLADKKGFKKEDLEYSGIDEDTGDYMITLSPKQSKGAAGRTFFVNPVTMDIK